MPQIHNLARIAEPSFSIRGSEKINKKKFEMFRLIFST